MATMNVRVNNSGGCGGRVHELIRVAVSSNGGRARQFAMLVMTMGGVLVLCLYSVNTYMTQTTYGEADVQLATLFVAEQKYNASELERADDDAQQADSCTYDALAVRVHARTSARYLHRRSCPNRAHPHRNTCLHTCTCRRVCASSFPSPVPCYR